MVCRQKESQKGARYTDQDPNGCPKSVWLGNQTGWGLTADRLITPSFIENYTCKKTLSLKLLFEGRRLRKAVGSKKDAENALAAVKADILRGEYRWKKERKIHFEDFAEEYLDNAKANRKRSWTRDEYSLKNLLPHFGDMLISKISFRHIEAYKKIRIDQVKPATINRELACLKHIFNIAIKLKVVDENPVKGIKFYKEQQIEMKILDDDEMKQLVEAASDSLKPIIVIALNTGMRKGEILKLRWNDVDFIENYIFVKETKSGIPRKVPMNNFVRDTLKSVKRIGDFLFYNPNTKTHIRDIQTSFDTACKRSGLKGLRFHDLRHTAATQMVMAGIDLVTVKEILGHSTIITTMRYAHPTPENKRKAVNVLAKKFDKNEKHIDAIHSYKKEGKPIIPIFPLN